MQIPQLLKYETISDVLDLLGDQTKLAKRMKDLVALEETLAQMLKRYNDINDIEQYLKAAQAKMAEANEREKQTRDIVADAQAKGEGLIQVAKEQAEKILKAAEARSNELNAIASRQDAKERELVSHETAINELAQESAAQMDKATAKLAQADRLIAEYQHRLSKLKELAA